MFGLGALGQLALGQAGLFTVTVDSAAPTEYAGQFVRDGVSLDEVLFSVSKDAQSLLEVLATSDRSDSSISLEAFQPVRRDTTLPTEYQDVVRSDWRPSVEFVESISSDADSGVGLEIFGSVRAESAPRIEATPSAASDTRLPVELLSGSPTVTTDAGAPIEITSGVAADRQTPTEIYAALPSIDATSQAETTPSVRSETGVPAESSSPVFVTDSAVRSESLSSVVVDRMTQDEITLTLSPKDASLPLELTEPTVSANWSAPVELLGNVAVIGDANTQIETVGSTSQDWITWIDTLGQVSMVTGDGAIQLEFVQSVQYSDSDLVLEILQWARLRPNRNELWSEEWSGLDTIGGF
jgi:hypothetical protein